MTRTISQKLANMERRALALCALASIGKCHGVRVSVSPRRGYAHDTAEEHIDVRWELCNGSGIYPSRYTECILDNLWTETRTDVLTLDRMAWQAAVLHAAQLPGDTRYCCLWCRESCPTPKGHLTCDHARRLAVSGTLRLCRTPEDADSKLADALETLAVR